MYACSCWLHQYVKFGVGMTCENEKGHSSIRVAGTLLRSNELETEQPIRQFHSPVTERLKCSIDRITSGLTILGTLDEKDDRITKEEGKKMRDLRSAYALMFVSLRHGASLCCSHVFFGSARMICKTKMIRARKASGVCDPLQGCYVSQTNMVPLTPGSAWTVSRFCNIFSRDGFFFASVKKYNLFFRNTAKNKNTRESASGVLCCSRTPLYTTLGVIVSRLATVAPLSQSNDSYWCRLQRHRQHVLAFSMGDNGWASHVFAAG